MRLFLGKRVVVVCLLLISCFSSFGQDNEVLRQEEGLPYRQYSILTDSLRLLLYPSRAGSLQQQKEHCLLLAEIYLQTDADSAFHYARRALELANGDNRVEGKAYSLAAKALYMQGIFDLALEYYRKAGQCWQGEQSIPLAEYHHDLAWVYYYLQQADMSRVHYNEALLIFQSLADSLGIAMTMGSLGHWYEKHQRYTEALEHQQKALDIYTRAGNWQGMAAVNEHIGSIYEDLEEFPLALQYFLEAARLNERVSNLTRLAGNYNNLGDTYRKMGDYVKALQYTHAALDIARKSGFKYQLRSAWRDLSKLYFLSGKPEIAYSFLDSAYLIHKEIYAEESATRYARLQVFYELEKKNDEIRLLEQEKQFALWYRYTGAGLVFFLCVLGLLLLNRQRLKIRKNKMLYEKEQALSQVRVDNIRLQEQHLRAELENSQIREAGLQQLIEEKNRSLASHTLHIIRKNTMLEALKSDLQKITQDNVRDKVKAVRQLIRDIDLNFQQDKDWDDFRQVFENVHQHFFIFLQEKYPELSAGDLRLCALIKINLDNRQIASVLGISADSLRVARHRLKKKLGLGQAESLSSFIQSV